MSASFSGESSEDDGSCAESQLTNRFRLWIHAANLPRQGRVRGRNPSSYAVVTGAAASRSSGQGAAQNEHVVGMASPGLQLGRTEVVMHDCNPQFTETMDIEYEYGTKYFFFVHVFLAAQNANGTSQETKKTLIGTARFEVGDILGTAHRSRARRLRKGGCVFCRLEPPRRSAGASEPTKYLRLRMCARDLLPPSRVGQVLSGSLFQSHPDTILAIAKRPDAANRKAWTEVYRSPPVFNTLNPKWDIALVDLDSLCHSDIHQHIRISVLAARPNRAPIQIGLCETTVRFLIEGAAFKRVQPEKARCSHTRKPSMVEGSEFILQRSYNKLKEVGRLTVLDADIVTVDEESGAFRELYDNELKQESSALDLAGMDAVGGVPGVESPRTVHDLLVEDGCRLNFCVAIDFTSSNGDPRSESSLHYQSESLNDYEETIIAVGNAVQRYSVDQQYTVWGFGAKFAAGEVQHLFQCGPSPQVHGVDGIIGAYHSILQSGFTMSGPTIQAKVIHGAAVQAKRQHDLMTKSSMAYTVLLVVTDGNIDDFEETRRKLQVYQEMPLSVIFVGVGRSDFSTLYRLNQASPNNTTFVNFREMESPSELAIAALANLPKQLSFYMSGMGF